MNIIFEMLQTIWRKFCQILKFLFYDPGDSIEPSSPKKANMSLIPHKIIGGYYWTGACQVIKLSSSVNPRLLTHIYYAFLELEEDGKLTLQNEKRSITLCLPDDVSHFKKKNPHLKVLFSVVSKKDSFSVVTADREKRKIFIESALVYILKWNYDGLDLDWEFPKEHDKENFVQLLSELSEELKKHEFLLSAAVRAIPVYEGSGYNVPEIVKYLDIINIMTYDFYGAWSSHTGPNSPLYPSSLDSAYERKYLNIQAALKNWIDAGASKDKICLGIPFYGRSFTLKNSDEHGLHAPVSGAGQPAASTYNQIQVKYSDWSTVWNDEQKTPYKYYGDQWIGYDDPRSITEKVKFALEQDVAGVFIWQLGGDDMTGQASDGVKQPLLTTIYQQIIIAKPVLASKEEIAKKVAGKAKRPGHEDFMKIGFEEIGSNDSDSD